MIIFTHIIKGKKLFSKILLRLRHLGIKMKWDVYSLSCIRVKPEFFSLIVWSYVVRYLKNGANFDIKPDIFQAHCYEHWRIY